jgi:hypothetical protein
MKRKVCILNNKLLKKDIEIDYGISAGILNLWSKGINTYGCCEGHFRELFHAYIACCRNVRLEKFMIENGFEVEYWQPGRIIIESYPCHPILKNGDRDIFGHPNNKPWMYIYYFIQRIRFIKCLEQFI